MWEISNISIKGIIAGIGFDIVATIILSVIVAFIFTASTGIAIENQAEFQKEFESSFNVRLTFLIGGLVIALGMGFVAEWVALTPALINAAICGVALLLFHIFMVYFKPEAAPTWSQIMIVLGVLPLSIFGGWLFAAIRNT